MKVLLILIILTIIVLIFFSVKRGEIGYEIDSKKVISLLEDNYFNYVVDVRTPEEFNEGHLTGSINIPIAYLVNELSRFIPDKKSSILFICKKGIRSAGVVEIAKRLGYKRVKSLKGNWSELVYPN